MSKHKKFLAVAALVILFVAWLHGEDFLSIATAYAQAGSSARNIYTGLFSTLAFIIQILNILLWICFAFLNFLLDPQFISDIRNTDDEPLENMLHNIWLLSRDMVNIGFALILIAAAIYTVVRAKKELIQEYWSKFVLVVVLVNFSWFIPRVILDVANVTAATIFNVPMLIGSECATYDEFGDEQPCVAVVDAMFLVSEEEAQKKAALGEGWDITLKPFVILKKETLTRNNISGFSFILNGLLVNHGRLAELTDMVDPVKGDDIAKHVIELLRVTFVLIIHVALFFPIAAMFIAFLIRIPVLWITIAFMPFYCLKFVVKNEEIAGVLGKIMTTFVKAAFLPAMTAVPLAVGFILINAGSGFGKANLEGIKIPLLVQVSDLWQILWMAMSIGVLYEGVFMALKHGPEIMNNVTEGLHQTGKSMGKGIAKLPLAAPILPGPSPLALMNMPRQFEHAVDAMSRAPDRKKAWEAFTSSFSGVGGPAGGNAAKTAAETVKTTPELHREMNRLIHEIQIGNNVERNTQALKDKLKEANGKDYSRVETSHLPKIIVDMKQHMDSNKLDNFDERKFREKLNVPG